MTQSAIRTILVSACLLGLKTRYDGEIRANGAVIAFLKDGQWLPVPVCPEQLGGMATPRPEAEFKTGDGEALLNGEGVLMNRLGEDVTPHFIQGAEQTAAIARLCGCTVALLKERSPSCGVHNVYCNNELTTGLGVTAALLQLNELNIFSEVDLVEGRIPDLEVSLHE